MAKERLINHGQTYFFTMRETYLQVTSGNACAAAILDYLQYRHEGIMTANENAPKSQKMRYAQPLSYLYLREKLFNTWSKPTIMGAIELLEKLGCISVIPTGNGKPNLIEFETEAVKKLTGEAVKKLTGSGQNIYRLAVKNLTGSGKEFDHYKEEIEDNKKTKDEDTKKSSSSFLESLKDDLQDSYKNLKTDSTHEQAIAPPRPPDRIADAHAAKLKQQIIDNAAYHEAEAAKQAAKRDAIGTAKTIDELFTPETFAEAAQLEYALGQTIKRHDIDCIALFHEMKNAGLTQTPIKVYANKTQVLTYAPFFVNTPTKQQRLKKQTAASNKPKPQTQTSDL